MNEARQNFEAIARANGGTDFSLKQDGRYAVQNIQSRWTYFRLGWEAGAKREPLTSQERDAQRWRFLMENSYDSESATQFHIWEHSWEPHSQTGEPTEWKQRVRGIALIDFIDRAIEAALGIKE